MWDPPHRFADVQVKGPYRQWVHEHSFAEPRRRDAGRGPGGIRCVGGALANALVVRRDVERIFDYRKRRLSAVFANGEAL